jgi:uncharacterized membrane-anchored protein YitT (DUF2179 family)
MKSKQITKSIYTLFWTGLGAFFAAIAIIIFLTPNHLIDGGVVGISMILADFLGQEYLPYGLVIFNIPFLYLGYRVLGKRLVIHMLISVLLFAFFCFLLTQFPINFSTKNLDAIEIIILSGVILGGGIGLIIRMGGSLDGSEILAIIVNQKKGFTVGQVVLVINLFIFTFAAFVFKDWHIAFQSLMVYFVAMKVMDAVIVGLEETKSVTIISSKPQQVADSVMNDLGLGLTIIYGRGGYSGERREILYIIVERLQLAELKVVVQREDPGAFMAIENLHEVVSAREINSVPSKK